MPRATRCRCIPLALLAATSSPAACPTKPCESYDYHATAIAPSSSPSTPEQGSTSTTFDVEGLTVRIVSLDVASEGQPAPKLALRLLFEPREIAYSFDPGQIVLRGTDGSEWHPRVRGPGLVDRKTRSCAGGIGDSAAGERRYSFLSPKTCFDLSFDVTVEPATRWELVLAGLARGQRRLDPVGVRLSRMCWDVDTDIE
jgi:hypothetical protein